MGEYYNWVNIDRREYICPVDFDYGSKAYESMYKDSIPLLALYTLLDDEWKGNRVVWLGDECFLLEGFPISIIQTIYTQSFSSGYGGDVSSMIFESYKNVSGLFKEAEKNVREEINSCLEDIRNSEGLDCVVNYGVNAVHPYKGLFIKQARKYKYTINYTKKLYYSIDETKIFDKKNIKNDFLDPLPVLMGYGRIINLGDWIGDSIGVSNQEPEGYKFLKELHI